MRDLDKNRRELLVLDLLSAILRNQVNAMNPIMEEDRIEKCKDILTRTAVEKVDLREEVKRLADRATNWK